MLLLHRRRGEEPYFSLRHIIPYPKTSRFDKMFGSLLYIELIINIHKSDIILSYSLLFGSVVDLMYLCLISLQYKSCSSVVLRSCRVNLGELNKHTLKHPQLPYCLFIRLTRSHTAETPRLVKACAEVP